MRAHRGPLAVLSAMAAATVLAATALGQSTRPEVPAPEGPPAPPAPPRAPLAPALPPQIPSGYGQAPIDAGTDPVLLAVRRAVEPTEQQMAQIVQRYGHLRKAQFDVIRKSLRVLRGSGGEPATEAEREAVRERMRAGEQQVTDQFVADIRALLEEPQRAAWDACVAELDLTLGGRRPHPAEARWVDGKKGPRPGEPAPDFELTDLDGRPVSLRSLRCKPVVIEFGSYTCPRFRDGVEGMNKVRERFGDRVHWVLVYTFERHPSNGRVSSDNVREKIEVPQHETLEQRVGSARLAKEKLGLGMTILVDDLANTVARAYSGHPNRGYIVDAEGEVISKQVWINARLVELVLEHRAGLVADGAGQ